MTDLTRSRAVAICIGILAGGYSILMLATAFASPRASSAWTATLGSFAYFNAGTSDWWYNYDFTSQNASASYVDWPVRFLFYDNAEVDKVKDTIDGCGGDPSIYPCLGSSGSAKNFRGQDGGSWYWDQDSGKKGGLSCELDQHIRVYAESSADRDYDPNFGYYVFGTVHKDYEGGSCTNLYYSAEGEQGWWDSRLSGISGWSNYAGTSYWYNYESARWADGSHWVQSDGYTSYTDVP